MLPDLILYGTIYDLVQGIIPFALFIKSRSSNKSISVTSCSGTDEEIILGYRQNQEESCISILFDRYIHLVFASCMKYLRNEDNAQDAAMEIFESLPEKLTKFEVQHFKSWLFTLTKNHCLMQLRKKNLLDRIDNFEKIADFSVENMPVLHLEEDETDEMVLKKYLHELNEEQRLCIELMYLEGLSYKAISEKTGYELNQVKSYIQNGKRNLKQKLETYYENANRTRDII
ncbi:MAG: sigma-70 family RNA polymerase sigma factor [Bacteroidota bacterium]|nr:MAG: sigma-70 family RNA polymerase sigma factor [Bacteroidota bacterium]